MKRLTLCQILFFCFFAGFLGAAQGQDQPNLLKAMVLTGQSNHGWQASSAHYKIILEETGLFEVDLITSPPNGGDMSEFNNG